MITWFCLNVGLTALVWLFLLVAHDSPHRLRFRVTLVALMGWLLPWQMLGGLVPAMEGVGLFGATLRESSAGLLGTIAVPAHSVDVDLPILSVLLAASLPGLAFMLADLRHYRHLEQRLKDCSYPAEHLWHRLKATDLAAAIPARNQRLPEIRIQTLRPGAFTTGVLAPVIWLHEDLVDDPNLVTVVLHEYGHIRQHDNAWLWLIHLQEKLFWWNPLVLLLAGRSRQLMELSCDEFCAGVQEDYRLRLNALILACSPGHEDVPRERLMTSMFQYRNFNVERVRRLKRSYTMKLKHIVSTVVLAASSFLMISVGTAQSADTPAILPKDPEARARYLDVMERRANGEEVELTQEDIIIGMDVYRKNLEAQYAELQREHEALQEAYQELQSSN